VKAATKVLLESVDDAEGFECPGNDWANLPWKDYKADISSIQKELELEVDLRLDADGSVQDASFFEELRILNPSSYCSARVIQLIPDFALRFSNFGKLFTMYSDTGSLLAFPVEQVRLLVEGHGWRYVAAEELTSPYDGKNAALRNAKISWWIRFFDYI